MSSDEDFDDSDLEFTPEELNDIDTAIAAILPSETSTSSNNLHTSSPDSVPHAVGTSNGFRNRDAAETESPASSGDSFADEMFEDPVFLLALDQSLTQMEHQHFPRTGNVTRLTDSPHAAQTDGMSPLTFDATRQTETQGSTLRTYGGSQPVSTVHAEAVGPRFHGRVSVVLP